MRQIQIIIISLFLSSSSFALESFVTSDNSLNTSLIQKLKAKFTKSSPSFSAPKNLAKSDDVVTVIEKTLQSAWDSTEVAEKIKKKSEVSKSTPPINNESGFEMKFKTLEAKARIEYHGAVEASVTLNAPHQEVDLEFKKILSHEITMVYHHNSSLQRSSDNLGLQWEF